MKKIFLNLFVIFFIFIIACGCTNSKTQQEQTIKHENHIITANPEFSQSLASILNKGYVIANNANVYYTKSADFENIYFVGTLVKSGNQLYNAIWVTNDINYIGAGLVFSMNDYAIQSSGMADGRTNKNPISEMDDGYARINTKLLTDMSNIINKQ